MIYFKEIKGNKMDGILYPASLIVIALLIYTLMQHNNNLVALRAVVVGIYIVYSHEDSYSTYPRQPYTKHHE